MSNTFVTPFGDFKLHCDNGDDNSIQAWNQADNYLLQVLEKHPDLEKQTLGVINDEWGALSIAANKFQPLIYSDSAIFSYWLRKNSKNIVDKPLAHKPVSNIGKLKTSSANLFIMRLPKNLHFFQHQLSLLSQLPDITVYVAGMQKYWPPTFYQTAYDYFDDVEVYDGIKKAKCMRLAKGKNNTQLELTNTLDIPEFNLTAINYPNVFSRDGFDQGTRFFLENFPHLGDFEHVIDLACGNGLLGIQALKNHPKLHVTFIDESYYATQACAASLAANAIDASRYTIIHNNALHNLELPKADAVLCNPPFHQLHRIGDHIANAMIQQSAKALKTGGRLYLIGNRHLQYDVLLKKYFKKVLQVANNDKFALFNSVNNA